MRVSQLVKVRALAVVLGLVLVPSLAVVNAPPVNAASDVLTPVRFPGSAYGPGVTGTQLTRFQRAAPGSTRIPTPAIKGPAAAKVGVKAGAEAAAGAAVAAFFVGHEVGKGIVSLTGLPTSGSTLCDFATVALGSGCAMVPSDGYVPNSDIGVNSPGWNKPPFFTNASGYTWHVLGSELDAAGMTYGMSPADIIFLRPPALNADVAGESFPKSSHGGSTGAGTVTLYGQRSSGESMVLATWSGSCYMAGEASYSNHVLCSTPYPLKFNVNVSKTDAWLLDSRNQDYKVSYADLGFGDDAPRWYPQGSPDRPADTDPDPERRWRTDWLCSTGGPGSATSSSFRESSPEWPAMPSAQCSGAAVPTKVTWWQVTTGREDQMIGDWELPAPTREFLENADPECVGGGCELLLERLDEVTGKKYSCFANPSLCQNWFKDPTKTEKYRCTYGGKEVPLKECNMYRITFNVDTPGDLSDPDPANPDPQPPVVPDPPPDPGPDNTPKDDACPPPYTWLSAVNPWWYWKATTCALNEAFVPKSVPNNLARINNAWSKSAPGVVVPLIGTTAAGFAVDGTCGVIYNAPISAFGGRTMTLDTCKSPWSDFVVVKQALGVAFVVGSGLVLMRMVSRTFRVDP